MITEHDEVQKALLECQVRGWSISDNGLLKGQFQVNITTPHGIFCWWPFSVRKVLYHKRLPGYGGAKMFNHQGVVPSMLIHTIRMRLTGLTLPTE